MKEAIRKKWLDEMPERIISGDNCTYAEWLEKLVDSILQDMHQYAFDEFHKHRKVYGTGKVVCIDGKDFNEILRLGKLKAKELLNDE